VLALLPQLAFGSDPNRWCWPLASRCAYQLGNSAELERLDALLDDYRPGEIPPMIQAEREVNRARLAACRADPDADELFAAAIAAVRTKGTPYHLAHALLDHAGVLTSSGRTEQARELVDEARQIGDRLGAAPIVARATSAAETGVRSRA
jgi:hypothetical protein